MSFMASCCPGARRNCSGGMVPAPPAWTLPPGAVPALPPGCAPAKAEGPAPRTPTAPGAPPLWGGPAAGTVADGSS